jgi:hypothetical protein
MCKVCEKGKLSLEDKNKIFKFRISDIKEIYFTTFLKYHNNKYKELNKKQIDEIIDHALQVELYGIDLKLYISSIQWPRDYIPINFKS